MHALKANLPLTQTFSKAEITYQKLGMTGRHALLASFQVSFKEWHGYPDDGSHTLPYQPSQATTKQGVSSQGQRMGDILQIKTHK